LERPGQPQSRNLTGSPTPEGASPGNLDVSQVADGTRVDASEHQIAELIESGVWPPSRRSRNDKPVVNGQFPSGTMGGLLKVETCRSPYLRATGVIFHAAAGRGLPDFTRLLLGMLLRVIAIRGYQASLQ
jgi:hypothetical protein